MKPFRFHIPLTVTALLAGIAVWHGPIAQIANYHDFADQTTIAGIPHIGDVVSNLGFALVALWGWFELIPARQHNGLKNGWAGYRLFLIGLLLTAIGSSYYHLAPDNSRLVWDRLPIALACAGLLSGVWGDVRARKCDCLSAGLSLCALFSVAWWHYTEQSGNGDLRPYLLLQGLPIVLIPLWQWIHDTPHADRWAFGGALLVYVIAKIAELNDHAIAAVFGGLTGHTLKHLLATAAAALIVARLDFRVAALSQQQTGSPGNDRLGTAAKTRNVYP